MLGERDTESIGVLTFPISPRLFGKAAEVELKKQKQQKSKQKQVTGRRCKEIVAVLPCPGLGETGQPWSTLQSLAVGPALLSSPGGGGTRKEGVGCWMSSSRGIGAVAVLAMEHSPGLGRWPGFSTQLFSPSKLTIHLRGCQGEKKIYIYILRCGYSANRADSSEGNTQEKCV